MTISVSTDCCSSLMPEFGETHPAHAFELERLRDDANGQDAELASRASDDRCSACARAAAHAGGDEHHVRARELIADFVDHFFGGRAPDFRLRAGAETFGHLHAHLDDAFGL